MDWSTWLTKGLVALGALVMLRSIVSTRHILDLVKESQYAKFWKTLWQLMMFFFAGYVGVIVLLLAGLADWLLILTGMVFFFGATFVYLVVTVGQLTIGDLKQEIEVRQQTEAELNTYKNHLEDQVVARTLELQKTNRHLEEEVVERKRVQEILVVQNAQMQEDLELAREFQQAMLPGQINVPFLKMAARYLPQSEVSGDIYDFFFTSKGELCVFLGDATGHGVAAAFMTMMVEMGLESIPRDVSTDEVMRQLNALLASRQTGKSVTGVYLQISPEGGLKVSHAGHPPMVIVPSNGEPPVLFEEGGVPLGVFPEEVIPFEEESYTLQNGDHILIYSDGLTEWQDGTGEEFGVERLAEFLDKNRNLSPNEILDQLMETVKVFTKGHENDDDITILNLQYHHNMGEPASSLVS